MRTATRSARRARPPRASSCCRSSTCARATSSARSTSSRSRVRAPRGGCIRTTRATSRCSSTARSRTRRWSSRRGPERGEEMRRTLLAALVLGALAAVVSVAWASDQTITAAPPNQFATPSVTIDQGDHVTFSNKDAVGHDVTARAKGPDGKALFAAATTGTNASNPVKGTEYLTTGDYDFFCSIHPNMTGTLHVTAAGTPVPRPGGTTTPPPSGGGADTTAPAVTLKLLDAKVSAVRRRGALRVRVTSSEAATVKLTARAAGRTIG